MARISPVHSNGVINYAIAIRLFRTVLRDRLKNFWRNNSKLLFLHTVYPLLLHHKTTYSYSATKILSR